VLIAIAPAWELPSFTKADTASCAAIDWPPTVPLTVAEPVAKVDPPHAMLSASDAAARIVFLTRI